MNFNLLIFVFLCSFISEASYSQFIEGMYEGELIDGDYGAKSVKTIPNDGYIMVGSKSNNTSNPKTQVYVHRISDSLETIWSKSIGIEGNVWGNTLGLTGEGGFIIAGTAEIPPQNKKHIYILKLNASGEIEWSNLVGQELANLEGNALTISNDGGIVIVGSIEFTDEGKDVFVIKISANGAMEWTRRIGDTGNDFANAVNLAQDDGYIIGGATDSYVTVPHHLHSYFLKLSADGKIEWISIVNHPETNQAEDVIPTSDGGFAAVGRYLGGAYTMKMNEMGEIEWINSHYPVSISAHFYNIQALPNGNLLAVGNAGLVSFYLSETTLAGDFVVAKEYWGQEAFRAYGVDLAQDGGFMLVGVKRSRNTNAKERIYFIKTDPNYSTCKIPIPRETPRKIARIYNRSGGGIKKNSTTNISNVISIEEIGLDLIPVCSNILGVEDQVVKPKFSIFPNPTDDVVSIESNALILGLEITTPDGKRIYTSQVQSYYSSVSVQNFSAGIYLVTIFTQDGVSTRQMIVSK